MDTAHLSAAMNKQSLLKRKNLTPETHLIDSKPSEASKMLKYALQKLKENTTNYRIRRVKRNSYTPSFSQCIQRIVNGVTMPCTTASPTLVCVEVISNGKVVKCKKINVL